MPTSMDGLAADCLPVKTFDNNGAIVSSLPYMISGGNCRGGLAEVSKYEKRRFACS